MEFSKEDFRNTGIDPISNSKWDLTDYYELCCKSEFHGCAIITSIDKKYVNGPVNALVNILHRNCIEGEGWSQNQISIDQLFNFCLSSGYLSNNNATEINRDDFLKSYHEIIDGMPEYENFEIKKNGKLIPEFDRFENEFIVASYCIDDSWNNRQYLIETEFNWIFFDWGTGV